jgi:hypothetical protein
VSVLNEPKWPDLLFGLDFARVLRAALARNS